MVSLCVLCLIFFSHLHYLWSITSNQISRTSQYHDHHCHYDHWHNIVYTIISHNSHKSSPCHLHNGHHNNHGQWQLAKSEVQKLFNIIVTYHGHHCHHCHHHYGHVKKKLGQKKTGSKKTMAMSEARKLRGGRGSREDDEEFFCLSTEVDVTTRFGMTIIIFYTLMLSIVFPRTWEARQQSVKARGLGTRVRSRSPAAGTPQQGCHH